MQQLAECLPNSPVIDYGIESLDRILAIRVILPNDSIIFLRKFNATSNLHYLFPLIMAACFFVRTSESFVRCVVRSKQACPRPCNNVADRLALHGVTVVRSGSVVFMNHCYACFMG
jgi:hypothetical protein